MINLIKADLYKMFKSKTLWILFFVSTACAIILLILSRQIAAGNIGRQIGGVGALFSDISVISILGGVSAGIFICGDLDNKVFHDEIANGNGRLSIIAGKAITYLCTVIMFLIPYAVATGIAIGTGQKFSLGGASSGFLYLIAGMSGKSVTFSQEMHIFGLMLVLFILFAAELSVCIPLALAVKKTAAVIAIYYAFSIFIGQLVILTKDSKILQKIFACTPYNTDYLMLTMDTTAAVILKAIAASVGFTLVMLGITYAVFRKAEIK